MAKFGAMETVYFISDVHLGAQSGENEKYKINKLLSFLNAILGRADFLYIVGDLFDFWFEYRRAVPKVNLKILFKLYQLVESGVKINYFAGNHDVWLRNYLHDEIGIDIIRGPKDIRHNSLTFYVAHGDGVIKRDRKQRLLNRIFKNRFNIFLYRLIHPDIGIPLASTIARRSQKRRSYDHESAYRRWALAKLEDGYDGVVVGHTHKPVFERIGLKYYVNLGDWIDDFTYLEVIGDAVQLKTWGA